MRFLIGIILAGMMRLAAASCAAGPLDILLTNDDGYRAPGVTALLDALKQAGHKVTLVAPAVNYSGSSASFTFGPITVTNPEPGIHAVEASPATAVILGVTGIFTREDPPDIVISGINKGQNLGPVTPISGTVGAAIAALQSIRPPVPAIAVSTQLVQRAAAPDSPANLEHYGHIAAFVVRLVARLQGGCDDSALLPPGVALNINYPPLPPEQIKGVRQAVQGRSPYFDFALERDAQGTYQPQYRDVTPRQDISDADTVAFYEGYITVVPIDGDYTAPRPARDYVTRRLDGLAP